MLTLTSGTTPINYKCGILPLYFLLTPLISKQMSYNQSTTE